MKPPVLPQHGLIISLGFIAIIFGRRVAYRPQDFFPYDTAVPRDCRNDVMPVIALARPPGAINPHFQSLN